MEEERYVQREDVGRKGGAVAAYAPGIAVPTEAETTLGTVHWKGVWSGFVTAMSLAVWFAVIGYALFPPSVITRPGTAAAVITGPSTGFYVWTAIFYLVSLFIGGLLTSQLGRVYKTANAYGNGIVLWGLTFTLLFLLSSIGAGGVLGRFMAGPSMVTGPGAAANAIGTSVAGAWWFALFQFLALLAAIGGAVVGLLPEHAIEGREART